MKRFIILPLVLVLGVFVSVDALRAVGPLTSQEDAGEETSRAEAIRAHFDKLVSEDKDVKREALLYFGKVDKTFEAEVPLFTAALKDERTQVRAISAYALGKIGIAAVGSISEVEKLLTDSSATVQRYAKRALERLQPLKPAPKKLTAEEAADAMAYWIGLWEFTGEDVTEGKAPLKQVGSVAYTWDKKGESIKGEGAVRYGAGAEIAQSSDQKFDPVSGLFIWRWRQGGNERIIHRRYDPKTQIYHDKGVAGEPPPGVKEVASMRVTGPDSARWSLEVFVEGKLDYSSKGEMKRVKKALPRKELAKKLTAEEATKAMAYWVGKWEAKGQGITPGQAPEIFGRRVLFRWKEKGKSLQFSGARKVGDGPQVMVTGTAEFDPAKGLFVIRSRSAGQPVVVSHERYDPVTRTHFSKIVSPKSPPNVKMEDIVQIQGPDSAKGTFAVHVDGELAHSAKWVNQRVKGDWSNSHLKHVAANLHTLKAHKSGVSGISWSPDGARLVSSGYGQINLLAEGGAVKGKGEAKIWDVTGARELRILEGHEKMIGGVSWSPDGKKIATSSSDKTAKLWDAASGRILFTLKGDNYPLTPIAWSPDGTKVASGSSGMTVSVWNAANGGELHTFKGPELPVRSVAWSRDGRKLASCSADLAVRVWDVDSGKEIQRQKGSGKGIVAVAWSPDLTRLVSCRLGSSGVYVWDVDEGKEVHALRGHRQVVLAVAWSPDGTRFATSSLDFSIRVWNAVTGRELYTLLGHDKKVAYALAWSSDGSKLASGSVDQTIKIWSIPK